MDRDLFLARCHTKGAVTEEQRAELIGVDRGTLRRWLRGETSPLLPAARRAARALGVTTDELWPDPQ